MGAQVCEDDVTQIACFEGLLIRGKTVYHKTYRKRLECHACVPSVLRGLCCRMHTSYEKDLSSCTGAPEGFSLLLPLVYYRQLALLHVAMSALYRRPHR